MMANSDSSYWKQRAERYNNLEWVNSSGFIGAIIAAGKFGQKNWVLDVGTGTGVIAHALSPVVRKVTAMDTSADMIEKVNGKFSNVEFVISDVRDMVWDDDTFDRVVARYVFHHITTGAQVAMEECYRVLKYGGRMVFAEGVPPSARTKQDFIGIFMLKEKRLTFMPEDMNNMMIYAGFAKVKTSTLKLTGMSVRNWLSSSDLPLNTQEDIYRMHINAPDYFKQDYNLKETDNDCLIDMTIAIAVGDKQ